MCKVFCDLLSSSWWARKPLMMISVIIIIFENDSEKKNMYWYKIWLKWILFFSPPRELPSIVVTLWTHLEIFSIQWGFGCGISGNISRKFRKGLHPTFYWGSKKNGIYRLEQKWFWNVCGILRWSGHSVSPFSLFLFQVSILHSVVFCSLYTPF